MAYRLIPSPTLDSIPAHIIDFAVNDAGWTESSPGRLRTAASDAGITFDVTVAYSSGAYGQLLESRIRDGETVLGVASAAVPYIQQTFLTPSKLHLFGGLGPEPFIAVVIEFGDGFFRHLYLGNLQRFGDYTGGEVISGSRHYVHNNGTDYRMHTHLYLFGGFQNSVPANECGGVRLAHADLGGEIVAPFRAATGSSSATNLTANTVFGGFRDNINDQQIARSQNTFAGVQVLVPINLYLARSANRVSPIGIPPGVRMVNMQNVGADTVISVGGKQWRCFPHFKRGGVEVPPGPSPENNMQGESSYIIGYAYLEN